jgi:hypothetical protein
MAIDAVPRVDRLLGSNWISRSGFAPNPSVFRLQSFWWKNLLLMLGQNSLKMNVPPYRPHTSRVLHTRNAPTNRLRPTGDLQWGVARTCEHGQKIIPNMLSPCFATASRYCRVPEMLELACGFDTLSSVGSEDADRSGAFGDLWSLRVTGGVRCVSPLLVTPHVRRTKSRPASRS